jgi:exodeoxyribonuclease-1
MLPHPEACLITGITPQQARAEGLIERDFIAQIHQFFSQPETCVAGYNSIRFDDEVARNLLYRNFYDPYEREWQNGNSRWDIIDMVRMTYALRPEGIEWPIDEITGLPSFRLEKLTKANGITHEAAHDAMSDVYATIAMAKLIKEKQPKLYDYAWQHRTKRSLFPLFDLESMKPLFHVSSKYSASIGCCAMIAPICTHPTNNNGVVVYDLREDPTELAHLSVEDIRERIFTSATDLPEGIKRIGLKTIHLNKCPAIVPAQLLSTLPKTRLEQFQLDGDQLRAHLSILRSIPHLAQKIAIVFESQSVEEISDPDLMIYSGGFFSDKDKRLRTQITRFSSEELSEKSFDFDDKRLDEMLLRYKARNFPFLLTEEETVHWEMYRKLRLTDARLSGITFQDFFNILQEKLLEPLLTDRDRFILQELQLYGESILPYD